MRPSPAFQAELCLQVLAVIKLFALENAEDCSRDRREEELEKVERFRQRLVSCVSIFLDARIVQPDNDRHSERG